MSKAFDWIPHDCLFYRLIKEGVHGRMLKVLQSMYEKLRSSVRVEGGITKYFTCNIGTRQGCMLSTFLFSLFINQLIYELKPYGIYLNEMCQNINILLYADDIAICADTVGRLQAQINCLERFCKMWGMKINLKKSKVMVFRNGGIIRKDEKWYYEEKQIEAVPYYKYLGLIISTRMNWSIAKRTLSEQANKALYKIMNIDKLCNGIPHQAAMTLFDKFIKPVLLYGAEIWGYEVSEYIESIQVKFCKRLLGVRSNTSNSAVLGDCGRLSLSVDYMCKCIKYWFKLQHMSPERYPKQAYLCLKQLDDIGRHTWAENIKYLLNIFGFGHVWLEQGVGNVDYFMEIFRQRLKDCIVQRWQSDINESSKLYLYKEIKTMLQPEKYLLEIRNKKLRRSLASFRMSSHMLAIETGRHRKVAEQERICLVCQKKGLSFVENEFHFLLICQGYTKLREKLIPDTFSMYPSYEKMISLLQSESLSVIKNVALYIQQAFLYRDKLIEA